ncbi:MAG: hypothetical protein JOS17DRAFT_738019 [Linnemannia elongata]|nr:MAG: hypothetical protein JOS17DRAFT_738019 [Linnemannia elongata]
MLNQQQQHQHQLPRPIPSPTDHFSFECDRTNPGRPSSSPSQSISTQNNYNSSVSSPIAKNKTECLSSSAPSSASSISTYSPFSSFDDDNGDSRVNDNAEATTPKPKRERPLSRDSNLKQQRQRWASWNNDAAITKQQQQQQQHQESDLPPVQGERPPQQHSFLGVSTTASPTTTRTSATAMTTDDNRDTPIASPASFEAVQTIMGLANAPALPHTTTTITNITSATACTATPTTTSNHSSNPIIQTPTRQQKSAQDRVAEREQRRHSSEDGLASYRRSASSPPTSCIVDNINTNKYAIPPKCRMVFHMRDEVPRPREEEKTGLSEKRFYQYRPQPQARARIHSLSSSSDQTLEEGSMLSPLTSSPAPMKKPSSGKCAKMVSFKEPEPWRDITPPPPSHQPPSTLSSSSSAETEKQGDCHDTKQVRMLFTRLDIPTIMVTEPQQQQKQSTSASSASTPPVRRPMSEPILSVGSTVLSTSSSSSSPSSAHRHIQVTRQKSSTPPLGSSSSSSPSSSAADEPLTSATSRHRRNLSMPVQSTSSSSLSNVPRRMQAGQGLMVEEPKSKSGNKLLRLWRSATQKYGNHHSHHHNQQASGVGFLGGKGSDLEPLVSMARE